MDRPPCFTSPPMPTPETFPLACVSNAATFANGPIAPGEIVTLFGNGLGPQQGVQLSATLQSPFPTQAESVQVTFDGKPAPLLWVQDTQINLVVPWSVAGPTTEVCATYNNVQTNCLTWPVAEASPAVFTVDGYYAAALNQDGTLNSATSPAPAQFYRVDLRHRSGPDQSAAGRWLAGGAPTPRKYAAGPSGDLLLPAYSRELAAELRTDSDGVQCNLRRTCAVPDCRRQPDQL